MTNRDRASAVEVKPDTWVHLAGVYDSAAGRARFYLNGYPASVEGVATDPLFAAKGSLLFGSGQANGELADSFEGTLADVRTWARALDPQEVTAAARIATPDGATLDRPEQSAASTCPNPHGGVCLGSLEAGTHSTTSFEPNLSYTVPEGWTNGEDLPGNVLLSRTDDPEEGIWGGSYIGVYQNVRARGALRGRGAARSRYECRGTRRVVPHGAGSRDRGRRPRVGGRLVRHCARLPRE